MLLLVRDLTPLAKVAAQRSTAAEPLGKRMLFCQA